MRHSPTCGGAATIARVMPFVLGPLILCACVPWPHVEQKAPRLSGTVVRGDAPVSGVRVLFYPRCDPGQGARPCQGSRLETRTDGRGQFAFKRASDFRFFVTLGDPINCWEVCIESGGTMLKGRRDVDLGRQARDVRLECDLGDPQAGGPEGQGLCGCASCGKDGKTPAR